jgi:hypothetical protein
MALGESMKSLKLSFTSLVVAFICVICTFANAALAQEGHPYEGTWRGTIGEGADAQPVVMIIDYDGEQLNGMINPGRNSYRFENATHDAPNWIIDVTTQNRDGETISFNAVMHEIGSVNRIMEGTWTQGGDTQPLKITRE